MLRAHVNEMDVEPVNLGDEVRHGVDLRLALPPIMLTCPVLRELLHGCELDALRCIRDRFLFGPQRRFHASAEVDELLVWNADAEGADCRIFRCRARFRGKQSGSTYRCRAGKKAAP